MKVKTALILCAGYGKRLAPITNIIPKPLLKVKNTNLLDVGSSPGGWSQVASSIIKNGKIVAIDKKSMEKIKNVDLLINISPFYTYFIIFF